jgi:hypothetical protein
MRQSELVVRWMMLVLAVGIPMSLCAQGSAKRELVYVSDAKIADLLGCTWHSECQFVEPFVWSPSDFLKVKASQDSRYRRWRSTMDRSSSHYDVKWSRKDQAWYLAGNSYSSLAQVWEFSGERLQLYVSSPEAKPILKATAKYDSGTLVRAFQIPGELARPEQELVPMFAAPELERAAYLAKTSIWRRQRSTSWQDIATYEARYYSAEALQEQFGITWTSGLSEIVGSPLLKGFARQDPLTFFAGVGSGWHAPNWYADVQKAQRSGPSWSPARDPGTEYLAYLRSDGERLMILRFDAREDQLLTIYQYYSIPGAMALQIVKPASRQAQRVAQVPEHFGSQAWGAAPPRPGEWDGDRPLVDPGAFFATYGAAFREWKEDSLIAPHGFDQSWDGADGHRYYLFSSAVSEESPVSSAFSLLGYQEGRLAIIYDYDEFWVERVYQPGMALPPVIPGEQPLSTPEVEASQSALPSIPEGAIRVGEVTIPLPGLLLLILTILIIAIPAFVLGARAVRKARYAQRKRTAIREAKEHADATAGPWDHPEEGPGT